MKFNKNTEEYDYMEEAMESAAQCWCDEETKHIVMDSDLAMAVAKRIAAWMQTTAQNQRNTEYYRGLLVKIGESIGPGAFLADDGTKSKDVLCAKLPKIIQDRYKEKA